MKKKINLEECKRQLENLTQTLSDVDCISQRFLNLSELSAERRLQLNEAARSLKSIIIFAQADMWQILTESDVKERLNILASQVKERQKEPELDLTFKWVKSRKKKAKK